MLTNEQILSRLTEAVSGTDKELYPEEVRMSFAEFYTDKWDEATSGDIIAESFVDWMWESDHPCRRCTTCGKLMWEGYCVEGRSYYCSDECMQEDGMSLQEFKELAEEDAMNTFYTQWY